MPTRSRWPAPFSWKLSPCTWGPRPGRNISLSRTGNRRELQPDQAMAYATSPIYGRRSVTLSMTDRQNLLREGIKRPLPLAYHPLYRFYEGGALTRNFRGLAPHEDDWWSEDWVRFVYLCEQPGSGWSPAGSQHRRHKRDRCRPPQRCRGGFGQKRWSERVSPPGGGRSRVSWSSCSRPEGRSLCTPIPPENGLKDTSARSLGKRKPGSSWKHQVMG